MENEEKMGLQLLKKGQKGLIHALFSRLGLFILLLALQVLALFSVFRWFEGILPHILGGTALYTIGMVLYLLNSRLDPTAKITWLIIVMLFPVFGAILYWFTTCDIGHKAIKERTGQISRLAKDRIVQDPAVQDRWKSLIPAPHPLPDTLGGMPVTRCTKTQPLLIFPSARINGKKCCASWNRHKILSSWNISS